MRYVFIGDGRLAKHLSAYFQMAGLDTVTWSRRGSVELSTLIKPNDIFCLTTEDSQLVEWSNKIQSEFPNHKIVHFSGSQVIDQVPSYHPLMTFSHTLYDFDTYKRIPFVGELGQPQLKGVFKGLKNPFTQIPAEKKGSYHAMVAMAANFPQLIWDEIATELQSQVQLDFSLLAPLLRQSLENSLQNPSTAPTGAIARKDLKTINRHLDAIDRNDLKGIYYSFLGLKRDLLFPQPKEVANDPN